jgi:hypothetical protein
MPHHRFKVGQTVVAPADAVVLRAADEVTRVTLALMAGKTSAASPRIPIGGRR